MGKIGDIDWPALYKGGELFFLLKGTGLYT